MMVPVLVIQNSLIRYLQIDFLNQITHAAGSDSITCLIVRCPLLAKTKDFATMDIFVQAGRRLGYNREKDEEKLLVRISDNFMVIWQREYFCRMLDWQDISALRCQIKGLQGISILDCYGILLRYAIKFESVEAWPLGHRDTGPFCISPAQWCSRPPTILKLLHTT